MTPARVSPETSALAARIPPGVWLGTSSWSFPGWAGIVYGTRETEARLARDGLAAYASHPLLRAVGIDRTFYAPIDAATFAGYAAVVPERFRFLVKAHEVCTLARFPRHARYGVSAGEANALFLDAAYATDAVIGPCVEGLGAKAGPILFQLPPQARAQLGDPSVFAARLHAFLTALPRGPVYAVELRNAYLLGREYAQALAAAGAVHCSNAHPAMPELAAQRATAPNGATRPLVVRWMLRRGLEYEGARDRYRPFDRIVDEDVPVRSAIATLCQETVRSGREAYVVINNKAEGSAPLSAFRLAAEIAGPEPA